MNDIHRPCRVYKCKNMHTLINEYRLQTWVTWSLYHHRPFNSNPGQPFLHKGTEQLDPLLNLNFPNSLFHLKLRYNRPV